MDESLWKEVPGHPDYEAHPEGLVRRIKTGRILSIWKNNRYYIVALHHNKMLLHRIIAQTFVPNPENKRQVIHLTDDYSDNRAENLAWCTASENPYRRRSLDPYQNPKIGRKLNPEKVADIRKRRESGESLSVIANEYGVSRPLIKQICDNKVWRVSN